MAAPLRYPRYDLESALEVARVLRDKAGGEASSNELASYLNYKSTNNGAFLTRVAAARMFGFVEGHASRLQATQLAISILQPDYPETEARARLEAFESVPLFRAFLRMYEGQPLPDEPGMKNALTTKFSVPQKKASLALSRLLDSAEEAGLFRVAGTRTKLIRPTVAGASVRPERQDTREEGTPEKSPIQNRPTSSGYPKLIEGALESVNWNGTMAEEEIDDWCDFFKAALKIHFKNRE